MMEPPTNLSSSSAVLSSDDIRRPAVKCLALTAIALFFVGSVVGLIAWLSLRPHLPSFRVTYLSISSFNLSSLLLSAKYDIKLMLKNPNQKIDLLIDYCTLSVVYRGATLSSTVKEFSPFLRVPRIRESAIELETYTDKLSIRVRKRIVGSLGGGWSKGVIGFSLKMNVRVEFRASRWLSRQKVVTVMCRNLNVEFSKGKDAAGNLHEGRNTCTVDFE